MDNMYYIESYIVFLLSYIITTYILNKYFTEINKSNIIYQLLIQVIIYGVIYILLTYLFDKYNKNKYNENFVVDTSGNLTEDLKSKSNENNKSFRITDDALFVDVVLHENDINYKDDNINTSLGIEKCLKKCKGVCVEYGLSGNAYCFPNDFTKVKEDYIKLLNKQLDQEQKQTI